MAANRFSKITGLPDWQPTVPIETLQKALFYKQELLDRNVNMVSDALNKSKSIGDNIINDEARAKYKEAYTKISENVKSNFKLADLSNDAVLNNVASQFSPLVNDKDLTSTISKELKIRDDMNLMNKWKLDNDERYSAEHEEIFNTELALYKKSSMKDGRQASYRANVDADKALQEAVKNFKPDDITTSRRDGKGAITVEHNASVYEDQLKVYLDRVLPADVKAELQYRGYGQHLRNYVANSDTFSRNLYADELKNHYLHLTDSKIKAYDAELQKANNQILAPKISDEDLAKTIQYRDSLLESKNQLVNRKNTITNGMTDAMLQDIAMNQYADNQISSYAKANAHIVHSEKIETDEAYFKTLNYNLDAKELMLKSEEVALKRREITLKEREFESTLGNGTSAIYGVSPVLPEEGAEAYAAQVAAVDNEIQSQLGSLQDKYFTDYANALFTNGTQEQKRVLMKALNLSSLPTSGSLSSEQITTLSNNASLVAAFNSSINKYLSLSPNDKNKKTGQYGWMKSVVSDPQLRTLQTLYDKQQERNKEVQKVFSERVDIIDPVTKQKRQLTNTEKLQLSMLAREIEKSDVGLSDSQTLRDLRDNPEAFNNLLKSNKYGSSENLKKLLDIIYVHTQGGVNMNSFGIEASSQMAGKIIDNFTLSKEDKQMISNFSSFINGSASKLDNTVLKVAQMPSLTFDTSRDGKGNIKNKQEQQFLIQQVNRGLSALSRTTENLLPADAQVIYLGMDGTVKYQTGTIKVNGQSVPNYTQTIKINLNDSPELKSYFYGAQEMLLAKSSPTATSGSKVYGGYTCKVNNITRFGRPSAELYISDGKQDYTIDPSSFINAVKSMTNQTISIDNYTSITGIFDALNDSQRQELISKLLK